MPNHYHLLVESSRAALTSGMLVLNGWYARRFNLRYDHVDHVFGGPYSAAPVMTDEHALEASRYIVLNPVRAGLAPEPGRWQWSSFRATAGLAPRPAWLETTWTRNLCGGTAARYRTFVADGLRLDTATAHRR